MGLPMAVQESSRAQVTVLSSGLGDQCLFCMAAGKRCVGYDPLLESMVGKSAELIERHWLQDCGMEFHVGDARTAPLSPHDGLPSLLWLNDMGGPLEHCRDVLQRAVVELAPGSAVVSYRPDVDIPRGLYFAEALLVQASWNLEQQVCILTRSSLHQTGPH